MKKVITSIIIFASLLLFASCSAVVNSGKSLPAFSEKNFDKKFTPAELKEDLNFLVTTTEQVHPNPFYLSRRLKKWKIL